MFKYIGLGNFPLFCYSNIFQCSDICIFSVAFGFIVLVATGLFTSMSHIFFLSGDALSCHVTPPLLLQTPLLALPCTLIQLVD